jgi:hypothetical protein
MHVNQLRLTYRTVISRFRSLLTLRLNALEAYTMVCMAHSVIDKSAQSFNREDEHPQKCVRDYTTHCENILGHSELCLGMLLTTQLRRAQTLCERACQSRLCQNAHCREKLPSLL